LTNAVKYAFPENQRGTIHVSVKQKDDTVTLRVADNGRGLPKHFDVNKTNTLGLQLVTTLTEQLDGILEVRNSKGAEFVLTFKKTK
jgi:two-component sensor histidine kinase